MQEQQREHIASVCTKQKGSEVARHAECRSLCCKISNNRSVYGNSSQLPSLEEWSMRGLGTLTAQRDVMGRRGTRPAWTMRSVTCLCYCYIEINPVLAHMVS